MRNMKTGLPLLILLVFSTITFAQQSDHSHDEHLESLVSSYLEMMNALADDQFDEAKEYLREFSGEVTASREMTNHPEHAEMHNAHHSTMLAAVESASKAEDIEQIRGAFDKISGELLKAVKNQGYEGTLFVQYCPMANNGDGAKWLNDSEVVRNPYFGANMLHCGANTGKAVESNHR